MSYSSFCKDLSPNPLIYCSYHHDLTLSSSSVLDLFLHSCVQWDASWSDEWFVQFRSQASRQCLSSTCVAVISEAARCPGSYDHSLACVGFLLLAVSEGPWKGDGEKVLSHALLNSILFWTSLARSIWIALASASMSYTTSVNHHSSLSGADDNFESFWLLVITAVVMG